MDLLPSVAFLAAAALLLATPGPAMVFVLTHSIASGRRAGLAAAVGIALGDVALTLLSTIGLARWMAQGPWALALLNALSATYFAWSALSLWRATDCSSTAAASHQTGGAILRGASLTLLNPNALLFYAAFLPRFVTETRPEAVSTAVATLGLWLTLLAFVFHGGIAVAAQMLQRLLRSRQSSDKKGGGLSTLALTSLYGLLAADALRQLLA